MDLPFQLACQTAQGVVLSLHHAPAGSTVVQALAGIPVHLKHRTIGVWSLTLKPNQLLQAGDRVELYLPLIADPKDARRARVNRTLAQQATKENAANRAVNRAARLRRAQTQHTVHNRP